MERDRLKFLTDALFEVLNMYVDDYADLDEESNVQYMTTINALCDLCSEEYNKIYTPTCDESIVFGQNKQIDSFSCSECIFYFRFRKDGLIQVAAQLWPRLSGHLGSEDPNRIPIGNRNYTTYETCLCLYLYRMSRPNRLHGDTERFFGMHYTKCSLAINHFGRALGRLAHQYFYNPQIWQGRFPLYAEAIRQKTGNLARNVWGFLDATIRETCRPIRFQHLYYSGYKHCHAIKFQTVVVPEGFIACLAGPYIGRMHDARIFRESGLLESLRQIMPVGNDRHTYVLYADFGYPQSWWCFGGFWRAERGSDEALYNERMSSSRISVEWGYGKVLSQWAHIDFSKSSKILLEPIAQQYINCAFLTNLFTCLYGNQINSYFNMSPMSLTDYLSLIDDVEEVDENMEE